MNRKTKVLIRKLVLFLIIAGLVIFGFWFFNKKDVEKPNEPGNEEIPENPSKPSEKPKPDPVGTTYLNKINYTTNIDKDIEKVIVEYMDLYYKSMKELKEYDMTYLFNNKEQSLINQTAVSLLVEIRNLKPTDLKLDSAKYDLDIKSVTKNGDSVKVVLRENNYLHFNFMKEIESKVYNIENEFTLTKVNGEYKITKYNKVQDFFVMITDKYKSGGKESLDKIKNDYLTIIKKNVSDDKKNYELFLKGEGITKKTCDYGYDRDKALKYAKSWVNKRNSEWTKFDSNCQNFASQMLIAGGIPMDHTGDASKYLQWKFYNNSYNESQNASGYVYTWTYVPYFYTYAKNNTGQGLCASVDVNIYYAEAGDVIHVGTTGPTRHALVSIGTYKKDNKVVDVLVNSNTVDLENYPMSAYVYPYTSLIKVYGYNK